MFFDYTFASSRLHTPPRSTLFRASQRSCPSCNRVLNDDLNPSVKYPLRSGHFVFKRSQQYPCGHRVRDLTPLVVIDGYYIAGTFVSPNETSPPLLVDECVAHFADLLMNCRKLYCDLLSKRRCRACQRSQRQAWVGFIQQTIKRYSARVHALR